MEVGVDGVHKGFSDQVVSALLDIVGVEREDSQVLCHLTGFDSLHGRVFKGLGKKGELFIAIKLGTVKKAASPSKDGCDRV